jgi:hypothetical protein
MKKAFVEIGHDSSEVMLFGANIKDSPITATNYIQSKQLPPDHATNYIQSKQLPPDHVDIKTNPSTSTNYL